MKCVLLIVVVVMVFSGMFVVVGGSGLSFLVLSELGLSYDLVEEY